MSFWDFALGATAGVTATLAFVSTPVWLVGTAASLGVYAVKKYQESQQVLSERPSPEVLVETATNAAQDTGLAQQIREEQARLIDRQEALNHNNKAIASDEAGMARVNASNAVLTQENVALREDSAGKAEAIENLEVQVNDLNTALSTQHHQRQVDQARRLEDIQLILERMRALGYEPEGRIIDELLVMTRQQQNQAEALLRQFRGSLREHLTGSFVDFYRHSRSELTLQLMAQETNLDQVDRRLAQVGFFREDPFQPIVGAAGPEEPIENAPAPDF